MYFVFELWVYWRILSTNVSALEELGIKSYLLKINVSYSRFFRYTARRTGVMEKLMVDRKDNERDLQEDFQPDGDLVIGLGGENVA